MNSIKIIALALSVISLTTLSACGPSESTRDLYNDQLHQEAQKTAAEFQGAVGTYQGTMSGYNQISQQTNSAPAVLQIWLTSNSTTSSGSSEPIDVPTLAGSLTYFPVPGRQDLGNIESFTSGDYYISTGIVTLYAATGGSGNLAAGQGVHLTLKGNTLTGEFDTQGQANTLTLTRVSTTGKGPTTPPPTTTTTQPNQPTTPAQPNYSKIAAEYRAITNNYRGTETCNGTSQNILISLNYDAPANAAPNLKGSLTIYYDKASGAIDFTQYNVGSYDSSVGLVTLSSDASSTAKVLKLNLAKKTLSGTLNGCTIKAAVKKLKPIPPPAPAQKNSKAKDAQ